MSPWNIPYFISIDDYLEFYTHFLHHRPAGKKALLTYRFSLVLLLICFSILSFLSDNNLLAFLIRSVVFIIGAVIWWFICPRILVNSAKKRVEKTMSNGNTDNMLFTPRGLLVFDFQNRILIDSSDTEEIRVKFDRILNCYETENAFYLYYASSKCIMIPYKLFNTREELYAFGNALHCNLNPGIFVK